MARTKPKQPIESFDPRFKQLLMKGALERITIPFPGPDGRGRAHVFQRRIHTFRVRMRQEQHEHYPIVSKAICRIFWGPKAFAMQLTQDSAYQEDEEGQLGAFLIIEPNDAQFEDVFAKINLDPPYVSGATVPEQQVAPPIEIPPAEELDINDLLATLGPDRED